MDRTTLSARLAQAQACLSEIQSRLDGLSAAECEALSARFAPLLDGLDAPGVAQPPWFEQVPSGHRSVLDAISAGVLVYGAGQHIHFANQKAVEYIGYDPTGETYDDFMVKLQVTDPEGRLLSIQELPLHRAWQGERIRDLPLVITNPGGQVFQVLVTAITFLQDGAVCGAVVIWNDVTLLERANLEIQRRGEQLRQSEERFRVALANTDIFVYTLDRDLRYTWLYSPRHNEAAQRALGKRNDQILTVADARELEERKRQVIESGVGFREEVRVMVQGVLRVFDMTIEPLRGSDGQVIGLTGASMDITTLRHLEDSQNEYAARIALHHRLIEQRDQNLLHFSQKIHDTGLQAAISLIAGIQLAQEIAPGSPASAVLAETEARARSLADDLKQICRELNPPSATRFGLKRAIQAHTRDLHSRYPGVAFELHLMEDILKLPDATCLALYRIYREAVQNALQHSGAPVIAVRLNFSARQIELEIMDKGRGFAPPTNWMDLVRNGQFGLISMKAQADSIQAGFSLASAPGDGTRVSVSVPYR